MVAGSQRRHDSGRLRAAIAAADWSSSSGSARAGATAVVLEAIVSALGVDAFHRWTDDRRAAGVEVLHQESGRIPDGAGGADDVELELPLLAGAHAAVLVHHLALALQYDVPRPRT